MTLFYHFLLSIVILINISNIHSKAVDSDEFNLNLDLNLNIDIKSKPKKHKCTKAHETTKIQTTTVTTTAIKTTTLAYFNGSCSENYYDGFNYQSNHGFFKKAAIVADSDQCPTIGK